MPFTELGLGSRTSQEALVEQLLARVNRLEQQPPYGRVVGYFTGSGVAIGTTDTIIATGDIVIPADWNTYDLVVHWSLRAVDSSGGNAGIATIVTVSVAVDGVTVPSAQSGEINDLNINDILTMSGPGWSDGETITGTRTLDLVAVRTGNPTLTAFGVRLMVEAWRTS